MYLRELTLPIIEDEMDPESARASLAVLQAIDTSSSQWRKTKRGSIKTQELEDLQEILNQLGYNAGKADGWFGRRTARAVMQFQRDHDLTVDGDPGQNTIAKMIEVVGGIYYGTQEGTPDSPKEVNRLLLGQLNDHIFKFTPEKYEELKDTHEVVYVRFRRETLYLAPIVPFPNNQTPPANPEGPILDGSGMPMPEQPDSSDDEIVNIARNALDSLDNESLEEKQVWAKSGQKVVRKYRCSAGSRKGRVVKEPAQCFRAPDIKKRIKLKQTKARMGARMSRKAKRTKRVNPTSRRVAALNRMAR
jgi:peptidoglycan hydrolase-like protein with peptidoglycan-binding domain